MRTHLLAAAAVLAFGVPAGAVAQTATPRADGGPAVDAEVIQLPDWRYDALYQDGWSADEFIDDVDVHGPAGEEIGDIENIVVGPDGRIRSVIAEVGGFWDIGDTHVNVPWDQVTWDKARERVTIPVTEESVDDYAVDVEETGWLSASEAGQRVQAVDDDLEVGPRAWLVSELIGDYARLREGVDYGYVDDVIFGQDGGVQAVVVRPDSGYGTSGYFGYPYYGYGYGFDPGQNYYEMPYTEGDVAGVDPLDYDAFD
ncbi:PRC-barrel domain-containing protein [Azospirillum sp. ST 5-10]|uniref:PRC-barrel domain-containing protein n=1 Tax=unclassified Azospirillum TaxID=2630922 RepID=UPI003F4A280F